ncbi:hypothetical protein NEUTE2DRAFT_125159 [Neurospora tetrasperma FGSC 2509]|nr:hypothetical protein NEUTE2DRAFT_125159 [Neurospora tetrasperma FGSC 2509]
MGNGRSHICTGWNAYCLTTTIYESYPSATNSWISYGCSDVTGDRHFTLYRNLDIPMASTTTTSFAQHGTSSDGPAKTASPGLSISGVASQPTDNSNSTKSSSPGSKAWIAAAAGGPVVGLLVIGVLIFCAISQVRRSF